LENALLRGAETDYLAGTFFLPIMTLDEAIDAVDGQFRRMSEIYCKPLFDEWALVAVLGGKGKALHYAGSRGDEFLKQFHRDAQAFAVDMQRPSNLGDFEFARHGDGTRFDAILVVGDGLFLLCNNTQQSMATITRDPLWLSAQVPFVELSEAFRSNPLVYPM
jgi:hypothetical protein